MTNSPAPRTTTEPLLSPVWVLRGIANDPGYLALAQGRLLLVSTSSGGPAFDVALSEVGAVAWPWWWFGGGFTAVVAGRKHKVTFVRPNGALGPDRGLLDGADSVLALFGDSSGHSLAGLADVAEGRAQARRWRQVLPAR